MNAVSTYLSSLNCFRLPPQQTTIRDRDRGPERDRRIEVSTTSSSSILKLSLGAGGPLRWQGLVVVADQGYQQEEGHLESQDFPSQRCPLLPKVLPPQSTCKYNHIIIDIDMVDIDILMRHKLPVLMEAQCHTYNVKYWVFVTVFEYAIL